MKRHIFVISKFSKNEQPKPVSDENSRNVEEIIIPPEKREEILNQLREV